MAPPDRRLAASLSALRHLQQDGRRVFRSRELGRIHRERLIRNGYLQEVIKGWLMSPDPGDRDGFWEFCARYCRERFGDDWRLSPEQSLLLHAGNTAVPSQLTVSSPRGMNNRTALPFGASLYDLKQPHMPPPEDLTVRDGLRLFTPAAALIRVPEGFFKANPVETRAALASVPDPSDFQRRLLDGGHTVVAGRLAEALREVGRDDDAVEIVAAMKTAGYYVRRSDLSAEGSLEPAPESSPIVGRFQALWSAARTRILEVFPPPPGRPRDAGAYLRFIEEIYQSDAYHSLSLEGYSVSADLIDGVRAGDWSPADHAASPHSRDALAARGYWQAFQTVRTNIAKIVAGTDSARLVRAVHRDWRREMFQPFVTAGVLEPDALAGYRDGAVYLRTSRYLPPQWEPVRDAMPAVFELLAQEPEPGVRAVLGHWLFGYIQPFPDGNGRLARFLMNTMLASGGYPWTVIRIADRHPYLAALEAASFEGDIAPFARFIAERVRWSMEQRAARQA